jgi:hypothetical protein
MQRTPLQVGQVRYILNDAYRVDRPDYFFIVTKLRCTKIADTYFCEIMFLDAMKTDVRAESYLEKNSFLVTGEDGEHKNGS